MFGCEGGGCGGRHVETVKSTTSGSRLDAREERCLWWEACQNNENNHIQLTFGCEGGGGGGSHIETTKKTTSGSHLDMRKMVVVGVVLK